MVKLSGTSLTKLEESPLTTIVGTLGVGERKLELNPGTYEDETEVFVTVVVVEVTVERREEETPCWS